MTGFEPATTRSQSDHSTRLNYIPMNLFVIKFWRVYYSEDFGLFIILFTNKFCLFFREDGGGRTRDPQIKSLLLYQLSYTLITRVLTSFLSHPIFTSPKHIFGFKQPLSIHYRRVIVFHSHTHSKHFCQLLVCCSLFK